MNATVSTLSGTDIFAKNSSLYSFLLRGEQPRTPGNETLPRYINKPGSQKGTRLLPIGVDNGNYALKMVTMDANEMTLVQHRVLAASGSTSRSRTKTLQTKYRVRDVDEAPSTFSDWFLIGNDALNYSPEAQLSFPVGSTVERLHNKRYLHFLLAAHADLLHAAHYKSGTYSCAINFGFPNSEFNDGELAEDAYEALGQIEGHQFEIERQASDGTSVKYMLIAENGYVMSCPQTSGTFTALSYHLDGTLCPTDIREIEIIDFGGGHMQRYRVRYIPQSDGTFALAGYGGTLGIGKGFIAVARQIEEHLKERYPNIHFSDIHLQQALADGTIRINGYNQPLETAIDARLLKQVMETYIADILQVLQEQSTYVTFTGGGLSSEQLYPLLQQMVSTYRESGFSYIDRSLAAFLSAYGLYLLMVFALLLELKEENKAKPGR